MSTSEDLERKLARSLQENDTIVVFSGAGASAESGIPTFRVGFWSLWKGVLGSFILPFFGTPYGWNYFPRIAWTLYDWCGRGMVLRAKPNVFHEFLATMHEKGKNVMIFTQNVDGLHQIAGVPKERVVEMHGSMWNNICSRTGCHALISMEEPHRISPDEPIPPIPNCPLCGSRPRPAAVLFNDTWHGHTVNADLCRELDEIPAKSTVMVVGLSGMVGSADTMIHHCRRTCGEDRVFYIDPNETRYVKDKPWAQWIQGKAGEVSARILYELSMSENNEQDEK